MSESKYTLTKTFETKRAVFYHPNPDKKYTTDRTKAAFGCEFEDLPSNLNDFLDGIESLYDDWINAEEDTRRRRIHMPISDITFYRPQDIPMYLSGLADMWDIIYERLPSGFPPGSM